MLIDKTFKDDVSIKITELILIKDYTIRQCSKYLGCSKSYIHNFIHTYIYNKYPNTYKEIKNVLDKHYETKYINGGNATKLLWERINRQLNS